MKKTTVWTPLHKQAFCLLFFSGQFCFSLLAHFLSEEFHMKSLTFFSSAHASIILHDSSLYKYERSSTILETLSKQDKKVLSRSDRRVLKKELRHQVKKLSKNEQANQKEKSDATFRIIMIILLALGLTLVILGLAFIVAYSGPIGLGIGILIAGLTGIIFLTNFLIRNANKRK